jgi:hypothetical protein
MVAAPFLIEAYQDREMVAERELATPRSVLQHLQRHDPDARLRRYAAQAVEKLQMFAP